jgi:HlyD family secretion protein
LPLAVAVIVGTTVLVAHSGTSAPLTLTAKVEQSDVSRMVTAKGVVSAVNTADLNFSYNDNISEVDVKVGDKVKSGQKLGQLGGAPLRQVLAQAQQALTQQREALNEILSDYTVPGDYHAWQRALSQVDQDWKNVHLKDVADDYASHRQARLVDIDRAAVNRAKKQLRSDGCEPNGQPTPPVLPMDSRIATCQSDFQNVKAAELTQFNDVTTHGDDRRGTRVDRGGLISTYRADRTAAVNAYNAYETAKLQRPHLIRAQQAQVAAALVGVGTAVSNLENSYVYAPMDGTITAINGTVGEYLQGGSNLTPATPNAPGGTGKIPTTGDLAGLDQRSLTGGQGPNLGLQNTLPGGNTFIQMADLSNFSVVAAFNQNEAALINPGSTAKVGFDAFPGKTADGTVTAVAPIATTAANGVPMYYATVLLNKTQVPPALKSGLTGNVSVITSTIENKALVVPTSAVTRDDSQSYVQVPGPDGTPQKKMFTAGQVGDDNTQVLNGLKPGDTVLMPDSGPLPVPADNKTPNVPTSNTLVIDHPKKPPVTPADPVNPAAQAPAPATTPVAGSGTFPGDPGALPDPGGTGGTGGTAPSTGSGMVNPFANPIKPAAAPAH